MSDPRISEAELRRLVTALAPWHHDIPLNQDLSTGQVFSEDGTLPAPENQGVSLISTTHYASRFATLYPTGLAGRRVLDCACNAGAYCFLAREMGADFAFGFDVRDHWIRQAEFVQHYRTCAPTDRIEFRTMDLRDLPQAKLTPFDLTIFKGILYHLPDPVRGLEIAAEHTTDVLVVNSMGLRDDNRPLGFTLKKEGDTELMSGVHRLAWAPNSPWVVWEILRWLGFREAKLTKRHSKGGDRERFEIFAAREVGRLEALSGTTM